MRKWGRSVLQLLTWVIPPKTVIEWIILCVSALLALGSALWALIGRMPWYAAVPISLAAALFLGTLITAGVRRLTRAVRRRLHPTKASLPVQFEPISIRPTTTTAGESVDVYRLEVALTRGNDHTPMTVCATVTFELATGSESHRGLWTTSIHPPPQCQEMRRDGLAYGLDVFMTFRDEPGRQEIRFWNFDNQDGKFVPRGHFAFKLMLVATGYAPHISRWSVIPQDAGRWTVEQQRPNASVESIPDHSHPRLPMPRIVQRDQSLTPKPAPDFRIEAKGPRIDIKATLEHHVNHGFEFPEAESIYIPLSIFVANRGDVPISLTFGLGGKWTDGRPLGFVIGLDADSKLRTSFTGRGMGMDTSPLALPLNIPPRTSVAGWVGYIVLPTNEHPGRLDDLDEVILFVTEHVSGSKGSFPIPGEWDAKP